MINFDNRSVSQKPLKPDPGKDKREPKTTSEARSSPWHLFEVERQTVLELCSGSAGRRISASGTDGCIIEKGLIEAFKQKRAVDRANCVKKLVRETSTDFQQLIASNDSLKKQVKALQNRLRRMPARKSTKAKLGFKQKDPKSTV